MHLSNISHYQNNNTNFSVISTHPFSQKIQINYSKQKKKEISYPDTINSNFHVTISLGNLALHHTDPQLTSNLNISSIFASVTKKKKKPKSRQVGQSEKETLSGSRSSSILYSGVAAVDKVGSRNSQRNCRE